MVGACPNDPVDVLCCIKKSCKNNQGICLNKSRGGCKDGHFEKGFCPGNDDVQCCIKDKQEPQCPTYWVIGARGSGESLQGSDEIEKMRRTVAAFVRETSTELPPAPKTEYLSLPYPAKPVGPDYFRSVEDGANALQAVIRARVSKCPSIRIGLVGYSQGANVVNDALDALQRRAPAALNNVRAVLQIADPRTDQTQRYHVGITLFGNPAPNPQHGGILTPPRALPAAIRGRATSICISGDPVCDAPNKGLGLLGGAVTASFHDGYRTQVVFTRVLGRGLANRPRE